MRIYFTTLCYRFFFSICDGQFHERVEFGLFYGILSDLAPSTNKQIEISLRRIGVKWPIF